MSTPSLLNIPYLYKAGTLYSQIPESGAGDFTVQRTTTVANRSTRINKDGFIETVLDNVPRLDYPLGGAVNGCPALLVEPAATNSMFYSQSINSWPTKTGLTITDNNAISPDGTQNASYIQQTIGGNVVSLISPVVSVASGQQQSVSFYAKAGEVTSVTLQFGTPALWVGSVRVRFMINLLTGGITITSGTGTASSVAVGNGWYKYSVVTAATIGSGTTSIQTVTGSVFSPNSGDGFYLWGVQWEQNTSTPTSYIPTTTAAVTRSAEIITDSTASALIGQSEGTLYAEVDVRNLGFARSFMNVQDASYATNAVRIESTASNQWRIQIRAASVSILDQTITSPTFTNGTYKIAMAYNNAANGVAFAVNGTIIYTNASALTMPSGMDRVFIGTRSTTAPVFDLFLNDRIRAAALYPNRLTNAQLATLTAP